MKKTLFWLSQCTWGIVMNIIGLLAFLVMVVSGHKPHKFHQCVYFETGKHWGGVNLGFVIIVNKNATEKMLRHEHGHFIQNAMYGILFPFIVAIPSFVRYHYRNIVYKIDIAKYFSLPDYYDIWFEKQATEFGDEYLLEEK